MDMTNYQWFMEERKMASLNMFGPYRFNEDTIKKVVSKNKIGNYALGYSKDGTFYVNYVGRSDTDLLVELIARLAKGHSQFKFSYVSTRLEAFRKECRNYKDFTPSENKIAPAAPEGTNVQCN